VTQTTDEAAAAEPGAPSAESLPTQSEGELGPPGGPQIDPSRLDADAVRVVLRLRQHGYEAYLVGGCVRDLLVDRSPKDFDIATSATPNQVRELFRNSRLIGRRFRLAHVYFKGGKILEVSTFRASPTAVEEPAQPSEAAEGEMRSEATAEMAVVDVEAVAELERAQPADPVEAQALLEFTPAPMPELPAERVEKKETDHFIDEDNVFGTAIEDARRRDFTINGLFYDPGVGRVIDHVRGLRDLALREIRTIGDPEVRMREDPVRLLRGVRFACKLEFDIESRTYAAMEAAVEDLSRCSAPRLLEETFRLIRGGVSAPSLKLLRALDALKVLLQPLDAWLKSQDSEGQDAYWGFAEALDALVQSGAPFDDSMLLAALLLPVALDDPEPDSSQDGRPNVAKAIELLLQELVRTARLPRRIAERCRMILIAQRTLSGQRRRRGGLMSFRRHPLFNEALKVFEVWVEATDEFREELEQWKAGAAPNPSADAAPGPARKRRRRRKRRGTGETQPVPAPPGSQPV
jgi:poly(A) polymerase